MVYNGNVNNRNNLVPVIGRNTMRPLDESKLEQLKNFISEYQVKNGKSPTYRVIQKEMNFSGMAAVQRYMNRLYASGWVAKAEIGKGIETPGNLKLDATTQAPVVGEIACGSPILAVENITAVVNLPEFLFGKGELRVFQAKGDSMIGIGIYDKDWIIVRPTNTAKDGDVVVAIVEDSATVKTFRRRKGKIVLHPENPEYSDIIVDDCIIQGVVKKVIHEI